MTLKLLDFCKKHGFDLKLETFRKDKMKKNPNGIQPVPQSLKVEFYFSNIIFRLKLAFSSKKSAFKWSVCLPTQLAKGWLPV